ncbi:MAG: beta-1,3-glucanase family protein [Treponema sp.]|nr:beta-1,3-glucanase family protein [Treponema sp.]
MKKTYVSGIAAITFLLMIGSFALFTTCKDGVGSTSSYNGPVVHSILVSADNDATEVMQGDTLQFYETVAADNGATEDVSWSIDPPVSGVTIDLNNGLLSVGAAVPVGTSITVKAHSLQSGFTDVFGEETVMVIAPTPTVRSVTVTADATSVVQGTTLQFNADVDVVGSAGTGVTWSVNPAVAGASVNASGLLTVGAGVAAGTTITVRATSSEADFTDVFGAATVSVTEAAAVTDITVTSPNATVARGTNTEQFTANVTVTGGAAQTVTWSISSTGHVGTSISASGLLTVGANETQASITVRATSSVPDFTGVYGEKTINVPQVNGITVTAAGGAAFVPRNTNTLQFNANVDVVHGAGTGVNWSITSTGHVVGTSISASGLLTVGASETQSSITVRAASSAAGFTGVFGELTVNIPQVTAIAITAEGNHTTVQQGSSQQFNAAVTAAGGATQNVTWSISDGNPIAGTSINANGNLIVDPNEVNGKVLTIRAQTAEPGLTTANTRTITVVLSEENTPTVHNITVTAVGGVLSLLRGNTLQFNANVNVSGGAAQTVTWTRTGHTSAGTTINGSGLLTVAADETAASITVRATSTVANFTDVFGERVINIQGVTGVTVTSPNATVARGTNTEQFSAVVAQFGGAVETVTWSISSTGHFITGPANNRTSISATGLLRISSNETQPSVTVRATSTADNTQYGEKTITVLLPVVNGITVTAAGGAATVAPGATLQFNANVDAVNGAGTGVTWSVNPAVTGTSVNASGLLTVGAGVAAGTNITVRATSSAADFTDVFGAATVSVTAAAAVTGITVTSPNAVVARGTNTEQFTANVTVTGGAAQTVVWSISSTGHFTTGPANNQTSISAAGLLRISSNETQASITVRATSNVTGFTGVFGEKTINVPQVNGITVTAAGSAATVAAGATLQFTANVDAVHGAGTGVTWSINPAVTGTSVAGGLLTVGAGVAAGTNITVRATSSAAGFTGVFGTATVSVTGGSVPASIVIDAFSDAGAINNGGGGAMPAVVTNAGFVMTGNEWWAGVYPNQPGAGNSTTHGGVRNAAQLGGSGDNLSIARTNWNNASFVNNVTQYKDSHATVSLWVYTRGPDTLTGADTLTFELRTGNHTSATAGFTAWTAPQFTVTRTLAGGAGAQPANNDSGWTNIQIPLANFTNGGNNLAAQSSVVITGWRIVAVRGGINFFISDIELISVTPPTPEVTSVTITTPAANGQQVARNTTLQFAATVVASGGATQNVTWSVTPAVTGVTINASGLLTVSNTATLGNATIRAASAQDGFATVIGERIVNIVAAETPAVTGVTINSHAAGAQIARGTTHQFTASVTASGGASTTVTWSIPTAVTGASIDTTTGVVTLTAGATLGNLTVRATSTFNASVWGERTVQIITPPTNTVTITTPVANGQQVLRNTTLQFGAIALINGVSSTNVTWSVNPAVTGVTINADGVLNVANNATLGNATIRATSQGVFGERTVQIVSSATPGVTNVTITFPEANAQVPRGTTQAFAAGVIANGGASESVTWSVTPAVTGLTMNATSGILTVANNATVGNATIRATSVFNTAIWGERTVQITGPNVSSVTITTPAAGASIQRGSTMTFVADVAATGGATEGVTWSINPAVAGASINANGILSVNTSVAIGTNITVIAASAQSGFANVTSSRTVSVAAAATGNTITYTNGANGGVGGPGAATAGSSVTVTINPSPGYALQSITFSPNVTGLTGTGNDAGATRTFDMPGNNLTITSTFVLIEVVDGLPLPIRDISIPDDPTGRGRLFFQFNNLTKGAWRDDQIHIVILGRVTAAGNNWHFVSPENNGTLVRANTNMNSIHIPPHPNTETGRFADVSFTLAEARYVYIDRVHSGRLFISYGEPILVQFHGSGNNVNGFGGPDLNNPTIPGYNVYHEYFEFSLRDNDGCLFANTTRVDFFSFPVIARVLGRTPGGQRVDLTAGEFLPRSEIFGQWEARVPPEFWHLKTPLRIEAPCKMDFNTDRRYGNYFQPYIDAVWDMWRAAGTNGVTIVNSEGHLYRGQIETRNNIRRNHSAQTYTEEVLVLRTSNSSALFNSGEAIIRKPNTQAVLEGREMLDDSSNGVGEFSLAAQAQICAAFTRGVAHLPSVAGNTNPWGPLDANGRIIPHGQQTSVPSNYYYQSGFNGNIRMNHYAKYMHEISAYGLTYSFCYSDIWEQSTTLVADRPEALVIDLRY